MTDQDEADPARLREHRAKIIARTPTSQSHFFGFYDLCPWSFTEDEIVLLGCDQHLLHIPSGEPAGVHVWG
jgi:hypothetical protein